MSDHRLVEFDRRWLDGFDFCAKAYRMLDEIKAGDHGVTAIRLSGSSHKFEAEKRLNDEILPICRFVRERYRPASQLQVCWYNGNRREEPYQYDARIRMNADAFDDGIRKYNIEVSVVQHANRHLEMALLEQQSWAVGVEGIERTPGGEIESAPVVHFGSEFAVTFAGLIVGAIEAKSGKEYADGTVLILSCRLTTLYSPDDWAVLKGCVRERVVDHAFSEIFIFDASDMPMLRSFSLWGTPSSSTSTAP